MNYELLLSSVFSTFHGQKKISVHTKKLHNIFYKKKLGGKNCLFLGLAILVIAVIIVKDVCPNPYSPWREVFMKSYIRTILNKLDLLTPQGL